MPAMVGGFGNNNVYSLSLGLNLFGPKKKKCLNEKLSKINDSIEKTSSKRIDQKENTSVICKTNKTDLGSYLAGYIEGDGSIIVPSPQKERNSIGNLYYPCIRVIFLLVDKPLAEKLQNIFGGKFVFPLNQKYFLWQVEDLAGLVKIVESVNGLFRTSKIEALHRLITWLNNKTCDEASKNIAYLGIDQTDIKNNSWLSGFTDADGNFALSIVNLSLNSIRVQQQFRLEIRQSYHRTVEARLGGESYFSILSKISEYFETSLLSRTRTQQDKIYYSFMAIAHNSKSHDLAIAYFDRYPLFSSKRLNYLDWKKVRELVKRKEHLTEKGLNEIKTIKGNYNSKRVTFNMDYLSSFYN